MSSDINDEDEESIEDEEDFVFCSSEKGDYIEDSIQIWDENVSRDEINRIKKEETSRRDDHSHERGKHLNSKSLEKIISNWHYDFSTTYSYILFIQ